MYRLGAVLLSSENQSARDAVQVVEEDQANHVAQSPESRNPAIPQSLTPSLRSYRVLPSGQQQRASVHRICISTMPRQGWAIEKVLSFLFLHLLVSRTLLVSASQQAGHPARDGGEAGIILVVVLSFEY